MLSLSLYIDRLVGLVAPTMHMINRRRPWKLIALLKAFRKAVWISTIKTTRAGNNNMLKAQHLATYNNTGTGAGCLRLHTVITPKMFNLGLHIYTSIRPTWYWDSMCVYHELFFCITYVCLVNSRLSANAWPLKSWSQLVHRQFPDQHGAFVHTYIFNLQLLTSVGIYWFCWMLGSRYGCLLWCMQTAVSDLGTLN